MLNNMVEVKLCDPDQTVSGELTHQSAEGILLLQSDGNATTGHFYPRRRVVEMIDKGRIPR